MPPGTDETYFPGVAGSPSQHAPGRYLVGAATRHPSSLTAREDGRNPDAMIRSPRPRGVAWSNTPPCQGGDRRFKSDRGRHTRPEREPDRENGSLWSSRRRASGDRDAGEVGWIGVLRIHL